MPLVTLKNLTAGTGISKPVARYIGIGLLMLLSILLITWLYKKFTGKYKPRKVSLPTGGQGIPVYSSGEPWSPLRSVEQLYEAMFGSSDGSWWNPAGWGTDEETILMVLGDKTQDQLAAILNLYEEKFERDLIADFRDELSGSTLGVVLDYFSFVQS